MVVKTAVASFLTCCFISDISAQYDTNYVRNYNDRLVVSFFQATNSYQLDFNQNIFKNTIIPTTSSYVAQANNVSGFSFDYDKISFSIGWKSPVNEASIYKKGKTDYSSFNFAFSGSKYRLESSYRRYRGFFDQNTPFYDTNYTSSLPYNQNPSLVTRSFKVKGFYFFDKNGRFSYSSSYSDTSRQIKTAGTFLLVGNIYSLLMYSNSAIIPSPLQSYYGQWGGVNYFNLFGISIGPGYTFNKVIRKKIFFNFTFTLGLEAQHRYYQNDDQTYSEKDWKVSVAALDSRVAFGFNNKKFFCSLTSMNDYNSYNLKSMKFEVKYISGIFNVGYRFPLKEYKPIKVMKENKYYKMF